MSHSLETVAELITEVRTEATTAEIALPMLGMCAVLVVGSVLVPRAGRWTHREAVRLRWSCVRAVAMIAAMVVLGVQVAASGWLSGADATTFDRFLAHRDPAWTTLAEILTNAVGPVGVSVAAAAAVLTIRWRRRSVVAALTVPGIVAAAFTASTLVKALVARERPPEPTRLVAEGNYSFPSGHVTAVTALAGALLLIYALGQPSRARMTAAVVASVTVVVSIAATRLYLGVHWLTDVVGGALLGATVVCVAMIPLWWWATARPRPPATPLSSTANDQHDMVARERDHIVPAHIHHPRTGVPR